MKRLTIAVLFVLFLHITACGDAEQQTTQTENAASSENATEKKPELILDLKQISGKSLADVEAVLGKAESTEKVKGYPCEQADCQKALFKNGQFEIIFKSGNADRITISNIPNLTNNDNAIQVLGLPATKPSFKNPNNVIRYNDVENIGEISFFTDYALIQVTK